MKNLKERLRDGETLFGTFYKLNSQIATEMIGWAGFDFIVADCEHGTASDESVASIVRTAENSGLSTIIRVASDLPEHIKHALDCGAEGVQIPDMNSVEQIKAAVKECKYYPLGTRGLSRGTRNAKYGFWNESEKPYVEYANEKSLVAVHIENKEMADAIDEICEIPNLDVIFVGPADMSQSLGMPGKSKDPQVVEIACRVLESAKKHGIAGGIAVGNEKDMEMYIEHGARYILYSSDTGIFAKALKNSVTLFDPFRTTKR